MLPGLNHNHTMSDKAATDTAGTSQNPDCFVGGDAPGTAGIDRPVMRSVVSRARTQMLNATKIPIAMSTSTVILYRNCNPTESRWSQRPGMWRVIVTWPVLEGPGVRPRQFGPSAVVQPSFEAQVHHSGAPARMEA